MRADGFMKHNWLIVDSMWLAWTGRWSVQYAKFTFELVCAHQSSPSQHNWGLWTEPELSTALLCPIPFDNNHILLKTSYVFLVTGYTLYFSQLDCKEGILCADSMMGKIVWSGWCSWTHIWMPTVCCIVLTACYNTPELLGNRFKYNTTTLFTVYAIVFIGVRINTNLCSC